MRNSSLVSVADKSHQLQNFLDAKVLENNRRSFHSSFWRLGRDNDGFRGSGPYWLSGARCLVFW